MQDTITWIDIDQISDAILRDLATISLAPRMISEQCWVVWQAFLIEYGWLQISWSSILGPLSQFLRLNFHSVAQKI